MTTEATGARYAEGDPFTGRYWNLSPRVALRPGQATIRFADGVEADASLTRIAPDSGRFRGILPFDKA